MNDTEASAIKGVSIFSREMFASYPHKVIVVKSLQTRKVKFYILLLQTKMVISY